jgi:hypothetical protein
LPWDLPHSSRQPQHLLIPEIVDEATRPRRVVCRHPMRYFDAALDQMQVSKTETNEPSRQKRIGDAGAY